MSNLRKAIINNLPAELAGLNQWTFLSALQFGQDFSTFTDVVYASYTPHETSKEGHYYLIGAVDWRGDTVTDDGVIVVLSGAVPVLSYTLTGGVIPGYGQISGPIGIAAVGPGSSDTGNLTKMVIIFNDSGSDTGGSIFANLGTNSVITRADLWDIQGNFGATGNGGPTPGWPAQVGIAKNTATKYFYLASRFEGNPDPTKVMCRVLYTASSVQWTNLTVPDDGSGEGYWRLAVSKDGYVMAMTNKNHVDVGNGVNPTTFFTDPGGANDLQYSDRTNLFYKTSGGSLYSAVPGSWASGGPVTWTLVSGDLSTGDLHTFIRTCIPLDLPWVNSDVTKEASYAESPTAWFLVHYSGSNRTFVTRDWSSFYPVDVPVWHPSADPAPVFPFPLRWKFVGNRLFVFTGEGVAISGPLGTRPIATL